MVDQKQASAAGDDANGEISKADTCMVMQSLMAKEVETVN